MAIELTDHQLIDRLRRGDPPAERALWEMLYSLASTLASNYRDDDVRNNPAVAAYHRIKKHGLNDFEFRCPFPLYCKRIVVNECKRILDTRRAQILPIEDFEELLASPEPTPVIDPARIRDILQPCLDALSERVRAILAQFYQDRLTPEKIAGMHETNRNNVNKICHDGRLAVRRCLEARGYRFAEDVLVECQRYL